MADSKWSKVGEVECLIKRAAIDAKVMCAVIGNGESSFTAYPQISVVINGITVLYEPSKQQKMVL